MQTEGLPIKQQNLLNKLLAIYFNKKKDHLLSTLKLPLKDKDDLIRILQIMSNSKKHEELYTT